MSDIAYSPAAIAHTFESWLRDEVVNSTHGRNAVLDDFAALTAELADPEPSSKAESHFNRYRQFMDAYHVLRDDDFYIGRMIHHSLMFVSGGFRRECAIRSADRDEYLRLRNSSTPHGIAMISAVELSLDDALTARWPQRPIEDFVASCLDTNVQLFTEQSKHEPSALEGACESQRLGVGLAVAHLVMAAERRGSLAAVPILEPKSITDVSCAPLYPFA